MDPMTEEPTVSGSDVDPRRAVIFVVAFVVAAAGLTVFLAQWIPLWITLPASLGLAMVASRTDARLRKTRPTGDQP